MYYDYVAVVGTDLTRRYIDISSCLNFVQAVEIAILSINDNAQGERIIAVYESGYDQQVSPSLSDPSDRIET